MYRLACTRYSRLFSLVGDECNYVWDGPKLDGGGEGRLSMLRLFVCRACWRVDLTWDEPWSIHHLCAEVQSNAMCLQFAIWLGIGRGVEVYIR